MRRILDQPPTRPPPSVGADQGRVAEVLGDVELDIFNGLTFARTGADDQYVPARMVEEIREGVVELAVDEAGLDQVPPSERPG